MKPIFALLLAGVFALTLAACSPGETPSGEKKPTVKPGAAAKLTVNEVMPDNEKLTLGHAHDWIEIYSQNEGTVDLSAYALTDDMTKPNAYKLSGTISEGEYKVFVLDDTAPFRLSSQGETVYLTYGGEILSQVTYPLTTEGESFDSNGPCPFPTPGFANNEEGYQDYLKSLTPPDLAINEVLASGSGPDWVEIKNNSSAPIDLSAYTLSDKRKEPARYRFPQVTLQPGEFYVVYCTGEVNDNPDNASFKISATGETLYLSKGEEFADVLVVPADVSKGETFGRNGGLLRYFATPTPGADNGEGFPKALSVPTASIPSGLYNGAVTVSLDGPGTVYYTLDGSRPTEASAVYSAPISLSSTATLRTFCSDGIRTSALAAYTYCIGTAHDLPVLCVSLPQESLTGETGILNHIDKTYEYEGQVTLLEGGEEKFSLPVGFRLHGNGSRECPKQNFQLRFRSQYGAKSLRYPLFANREYSEFKSLLLKGGSEDWNQAVLRDELATVATDGTTALYAQGMKPVVLYLGGEYWGIYYLRERFSDDYVVSNFGGDEEDVDLLYSSGGYAQAGSAKDFTALKNYVKSHDMSTDENYAYLCSQIDAQSLMDWYICRSYFGDRDTANIRRFRTSAGDGKWRWMFFDLDWAFYHSDSTVSWALKDSGGDAVLIQGLLAHPKGKDAFIKRYAYLMKTALNEEKIGGILDGIVAQIRSEIPRDRERWGRSVSGWDSAVNRVRDYVRDEARHAKIKADIRSCFGLSEEQMGEYFK